MRDILPFKIICCCCLYVSNGLFSHEDVQKDTSAQKAFDTKVYGNWYTKELESPTNNSPSKITKSSRIITLEDLKNLKEYIKDTQFSGVVYSFHLKVANGA